METEMKPRRLRGSKKIQAEIMEQLSDEVIVAHPEHRETTFHTNGTVKWIVAIASRLPDGAGVVELASPNRREAQAWRQQVIKELATRGSTVHELPKGQGFEALDATAFMLWPETVRRAAPSTNQIQ
jgi:hypothetical protein